MIYFVNLFDMKLKTKNAIQLNDYNMMCKSNSIHYYSNAKLGIFSKRHKQFSNVPLTCTQKVSLNLNVFSIVTTTYFLYV